MTDKDDKTVGESVVETIENVAKDVGGGISPYFHALTGGLLESKDDDKDED